ncbi:MAG TPA: MarR family winged helix-turn-helix transcriptional regulator [Jatrophihabitans sp.]|jgi:DNA-binding MarR family transcriptional regulator|uniref:MarR family winged helix-turn-helix transcriptional regulator n=1 Tax=Jatrophihabitans sp. TaxID=1932789 RepID=UPI002E088BE0|nr:MarR family winged helix-turn-helix transcriptional regulator [Jatrophihabitans sp.]
MGEQPERDAVDHHVARWAEYWTDNPSFDPEVEGAITRMQSILRQLKRVDAAAFAGSDFTLEDYWTLHALMVQPYPTEATPAQLADANRVTRAAMTSRLDRLVASGLVTREVDPLDRRRVVVRPTAAGRVAWDRYVHEGMGREQHLLRALDPEQLVALNALLRAVVLSLDA